MRKIIFTILVIVFLSFIFANRPCCGKMNENYRSLYNLINQERINANLKKLKYDIRLEKSATMKACDLMERNYWSHVDPDGKHSWYMFKKFGYHYYKAGENLARDFETDQDVVSSFMVSKTHRENILGEYKDVGIGKCGNFTVIHFGSR